MGLNVKRWQKWCFLCFWVWITVFKTARRFFETSWTFLDKTIFNEEIKMLLTFCTKVAAYFFAYFFLLIYVCFANKFVLLRWIIKRWKNFLPCKVNKTKETTKKFKKDPYRWRCARKNLRKMCDSAWKCATVSRRYRNYAKYVAFDAKFAIVCRFWTVLISQRNCFAFGQKGRSFYWQFNLNSPCSVEIPPYINVQIGELRNVVLVIYLMTTVLRTLIKKKIKFSSYIRKFRMEQLQSHTVYD